MTPGVRRIGRDEGRLLRGGTHQLKAGVADTAGELTVWTSRTPFGKGPPLHVHESEDELFYVLEGRYEMVCGAARTAAEPGCLLFLPRLTPHAFKSLSTEVDSRLLHATVPGGFEEYLAAIADSDAASANGMAVRRGVGERHGLRFPDDPRATLPDADRQPPFRVDPEPGPEHHLAALDGTPTRVVERIGPVESCGRIRVEELHVAPGARWELRARRRHAVAFLREGELALDGGEPLAREETLIVAPGARCAGINVAPGRARWTVFESLA